MISMNSKLRHAFLLCFYLSRRGQSKLQDVASNLNLSVAYLEQIARKLRIANILTSVRGPGGGYKIDDSMQMLSVVQALNEKRPHKQCGDNTSEEVKLLDAFEFYLSTEVDGVLLNTIRDEALRVTGVHHVTAKDVYPHATFTTV